MLCAVFVQFSTASPFSPACPPIYQHLMPFPTQWMISGLVLLLLATPVQSTLQKRARMIVSVSHRDQLPAYVHAFKVETPVHAPSTVQQTLRARVCGRVQRASRRCCYRNSEGSN